ncbi:MAG: saccharopine dehydrogenase [Saprospiraceae bacterium]|nr:saccharopine dehydrogenase NADP-binding domain-containing protein [Bacteroidia bacterium]NNE15842.1 saccharopine dehydrogenase [Saprospiraceae bacterium]NNL92903.1 saccharopine dehydrogenase [Saprospiraceae bacterium]
MSTYNILIAGAGGIGEAAGLILASNESINCHLYIGDRFDSSANRVAKTINENSEAVVCDPFVIPEEGLTSDMEAILKKSDIILDCLPGSQAPRLAQYAKDYKCHYANLTEYVKETDMVTEIAEGADTGFILQTGLAPGYINVIANHLFNKFTALYNVDVVESLDMKVGALSKHARAPHFYAFTWSPIGVATEYVKDALIVQDFETRSIPSLSATETILIDGIEYEDDYTSGGAADLPKALAGKVKNLTYKTIRFPGHYNWAKSVIESTPSDKDKVSNLNSTMLNNIPAVEDDVVIVFASVKGKDSNGILRAMEKSIRVYPSKVGKKTLRAIQTTTAAPLCEAALLLLKGKYKGPVFQSRIDTESFLNGPIVSSIYGKID